MSRYLTAPYRPQPIDDLRVVFPANVTELMPSYHDIPEDFRRGRGDASAWIEFQREWFYRGLPKDTKLTPKDGIDLATALRHLKAIQASFEPRHEHKEAAVAYLASLWLEEPPS